MWLYQVAGSAAVALLGIGVILLIQARREQAQLKAAVGRFAPPAATGAGSPLQEWWRSASLSEYIQASVTRAGLPWSSEQVLLVWAVLTVLAAAVLRFMFHFAWLSALLWGELAVQLGWWAYRVQRRKVWEARLRADLPRSLRLMANVLRTGRSLPAAIRQVGEDRASPCAPVWARVAAELDLRQPLHEVLPRTTRDVPLPALGWLTPLMLVLFGV